MKKISLPIVVTIMCLLVSIVLVLVWLNQKNSHKKVKVVQNSELEITRTDYSDVTRQTLDWIDKQRNNEGWYILERDCDFEARTCDTVLDNEKDNKNGLIATWARFNYYQQTKDPKDLVIVKSDIDKFYKKYPDGVDNVLWICKITYDMWKSNLFDKVIKDKLRNICFNSKIPENVVDLSEGELFDGYFGLPMDLISLYKWKNEEKYLDLARSYLDINKRMFEIRYNLGSENLCLTALASVDIYEYGEKNEADLTYAEDIYNNYINNEGDRKFFQVATCGLLSKRLYKLTGDKNFLIGVENISNIFNKYFLDSKESVNNITDSYGFFKNTNGSFSSYNKEIVENGLVIELLRD